MKHIIYQVDAFTNKVFSGNPAAVCPLDSWLSNELMQNIAGENNLSETVFYVKDGDKYQIRWFTPEVEVDLCGHATLAAAYVLFNYENHQGTVIRFFSERSGWLSVTKNEDLYTLDFPVDNFHPVDLSTEIIDCFDLLPKLAFKGSSDHLIIFNNEREIKNLKPDFAKISKLDSRGVIVSARGDNSDFVSRFFGPQVGIQEDPVTGSAHTLLTPYWTKELNKQDLAAIQLSKRGGYLRCRMAGERVHISGEARLFLTGELHGL
jgi:PhzF family phenazine biosynthesis protein